jgi:hypothetical protein
VLRIFERRILKMLYGPINGNDIRRTWYNNELYTLYDDLVVVKAIKTGWLRWLDHLFTLQELDPCTRLTLLTPESTRRVGTQGVEAWVSWRCNEYGLELRRNSQDPDGGGQFWETLKNCNARRRRQILLLCHAFGLFDLFRKHTPSQSDMYTSCTMTQRATSYNR